MLRAFDRLHTHAAKERAYWLLAVIAANLVHSVQFSFACFSETRDLYDLLVRLVFEFAILASAFFLSSWARWIFAVLFAGGLVDVVLETLVGAGDYMRPSVTVLLWGALCGLLWRRHLQSLTA